MNRFFAFFSAVVPGFFATMAHGENLLTNGSFEVGFGFANFGAGSTNLPGWTISGDKSLYWVTPADGDSLVPLDGSHYLDLNGAGGSITLSQSFPTTPGKLYEVTFSVGSFQGTGGNPDS